MGFYLTHRLYLRAPLDPTVYYNWSIFENRTNTIFKNWVWNYFLKVIFFIFDFFYTLCHDSVTIRDSAKFETYFSSKKPRIKLPRLFYKIFITVQYHKYSEIKTTFHSKHVNRVR